MSSVRASADPATTATGGTPTAPTVTRTQTVIQTETVTAPQPGGTTSHTTTIQVSPSQTTSNVHVAPTSASQSSDAVPWWAWVLIGLGVLGLVIGIFSLARGRRHPNDGSGPGGSYGPPPGAGGGPTPPPPDRGPPVT